MKKSILTISAALLLSIGACKKETTENQPADDNRVITLVDGKAHVGHVHGSNTSGSGSGSGTGTGSGSNTGSGSGGQTGSGTKMKPTEWNCTFESHLKSVRTDKSQYYFVGDVAGPEDSFNMFMQMGVNTMGSVQYGRAGCYAIKEAWYYTAVEPKDLYTIRIRFVNSKLLPNLEFMRVGDYSFDRLNPFGYVDVQMDYRGKTYYSAYARNDQAAGYFVRITEYNSVGKVWNENKIAFQFNANLKSSDGKELKLLNVVCRTGTIPEGF